MPRRGVATARRGVARTRVALDWCVPPQVAGALGAVYGKDGFEFLHLRNIPGAVGADVFWADVLKTFGGRVVLSGDHHIGVRPHEACAFIDNEFLCFFPAGNWSQMKPHAKAASFVYWWPQIREVVEAHTGTSGACWKIPFRFSNGIMRLERQEFVQMVIPESVLDRERARRVKG